LGGSAIGVGVGVARGCSRCQAIVTRPLLTGVGAGQPNRDNGQWRIQQGQGT
jgi:hypothetical protein